MKDSKDKDSKNKFIAFIILIVLFVIFLGMGMTGGVKKFFDFVNATPGLNVKGSNDKFFYDGALHFSNGSTYSCEGDYCGWAYETIDDVSYALKYYNDNKIDKLDSLVDDRYAFIIDSSEKNEEDVYYRSTKVKIYDTSTNSVMDEYNSVKNYSQNLYNNAYIVQNENGKWGVINFADGKINQVIDFNYDFIGIFDGTNNGNLSVIDRLVVLQNGVWSILDFTGNSLSTSYSNMVIGYEGSIVALREGDSGVSIVNLQGEKVSEQTQKDIIFTKKNALVYYNGTDVIVISSEGNELFNKSFGSISEIRVEENNGSTVLNINGTNEYTFS